MDPIIQKTPEPFLKRVLYSFLEIIFYPFFISWSFGKKFQMHPILRPLVIGISFIPLFLSWLTVIASFTFLFWMGSTQGGILPVPVPVSGASMMPTILDNSTINLYRYPGFSFLKKSIQRKDLVVFENEKTKEEIKKQQKEGGGFVKRVIATPGDSVVIKDGFVYVNGIKVNEQYILKPRSTFGSTEVNDCQLVTVPADKLFVLGDNRKRSEDSRHIGLIDISDIEYVLPFNEQTQFQSRWAKTNNTVTGNASFFNAEEYVSLLNQKRKLAGLTPLSLNAKLSLAAEKRAKVMLQFDDLSFEATKSAYTMKQAMQEAGYFNIVYGEIPTLGYYDTQELLDYFFEVNSARKFLLDKEYQDIGIATFVGNLNGCPTQIVVQHVAGYIPPNYTKEMIESWKKALEGLKKVQPGWANLKEQKNFYQKHKDDVDKIAELISKRINRLEAIISRMEKNEWLTPEEQSFIKEDDTLYNQQQDLANRINNTQ